MGFPRRLRMSRFPRLRNTFPVVDDVGIIAFACAFPEVGREAVVAFEVAGVRTALTHGCGGGDCVCGIVTLLLLGVGVDLSLEVLSDSRNTINPRGFPDQNVLLDEEVDRGNTDTSVEVAKDVSPNLEVQIEADTNVSGRAFYEMLVEGRAKHRRQAEKGRKDGAETHFIVVGLLMIERMCVCWP